jgi:hypothetical protein
MTVPTSASKMPPAGMDEYTSVRNDLLNCGSQAVMEGMSKGPPGLVEHLQDQAELTNLARVGSDGNVATPAFQLNVASAVEPGDDNETPEIDSLGYFGATHLDTGDGAGSPTGMVVLSSEGDDVEEQLFFLFELGIAWILEPFSIYYFSGLHWHCGTQPVYKPNRTNKDSTYYRLTLIAYPPDDMLAGKDSVGFAGLPNGNLLTVGFDFRDP